MSNVSNPFALLLDPVAVLQSCAHSGVLNSLPVSALRNADRPSAKCSDRLREHDTAIDALFEELAAKSAKKRANA